jgi:hypothetical protein
MVKFRDAFWNGATFIGGEVCLSNEANYYLFGAGPGVSITFGSDMAWVACV